MLAWKLKKFTLMCETKSFEWRQCSSFEISKRFSNNFVNREQNLNLFQLLPNAHFYSLSNIFFAVFSSVWVKWRLGIFIVVRIMDVERVMKLKISREVSFVLLMKIKYLNARGKWIADVFILPSNKITFSESTGPNDVYFR